MTNLTNLEKVVLAEAFKDVEWCYYEERKECDYFGTCGYEGEAPNVAKIAKTLGKAVNTVKGALGSLCEKGVMSLRYYGKNEVSVGFNVEALKACGAIH